MNPSALLLKKGKVEGFVQFRFKKYILKDQIYITAEAEDSRGRSLKSSQIMIKVPRNEIFLFSIVSLLAALIGGIIRYFEDWNRKIKCRDFLVNCLVGAVSGLLLYFFFTLTSEVQGARIISSMFEGLAGGYLGILVVRLIIESFTPKIPNLSSNRSFVEKDS